MGIGTLRNNPCVCGSGKKYKRCCWGKKANEIRYQHIHVRNNPQAMCITCREQWQELAVKSAMSGTIQNPTAPEEPIHGEPAESITAEL